MEQTHFDTVPGLRTAWRLIDVNSTMTYCTDDDRRIRYHDSRICGLAFDDWGVWHVIVELGHSDDPRDRNSGATVWIPLCKLGLPMDIADMERIDLGLTVAPL